MLSIVSVPPSGMASTAFWIRLRECLPHQHFIEGDLDVIDRFSDRFDPGIVTFGLKHVRDDILRSIP